MTNWKIIEMVIGLGIILCFLLASILGIILIIKRSKKLRKEANRKHD